jgi:hypothetical protein
MEVDDVWLPVRVQPVELGLIEWLFASESGPGGQ